MTSLFKKTTLLVALGLCFGLGSVACSGSSKAKTEAGSSERRTLNTGIPTTAATAEELDGPCGNPNWAQLPEETFAKRDKAEEAKVAADGDEVEAEPGVEGEPVDD